ncbi:hypothetical protein A3B32_03365 [Candidatus Uhrbacteria bacterium RIFCSPLOWO2_01_FULL_53_9]|uniref:SHSP domain-containing protein n=1 Tax=Candidatus Uhrbacteria bacterium RIFCSPLOWO2_01_FULL_53_9 TaxID=1802403 RepID=A0A1F7UXA7_9BACT|nr:MAG: hypothetical protein A3B32_03365 [Candidatus Uhrbacteria bacterium RIFCSPLOWO2_01_FULL_53_9]
MQTHIDTHPIDDLFADTIEGQLAIDVYETDSDIVVQSAIAGVAPENLEVFINPDMVTIRGSRKQERRQQDAQVHIQECFWGSFSRSVILPCHVQSDRADAQLKNGVLTVTMPKQQNTERRINVIG